MIKLILIRTRKTLIFAVSVIALTTATALPAIPQEAEAEAETTQEPESVLVESTIVGDVDPSQAVSVEDLTIPVDQLDLFVKPLTLEELQVEAAAWFLLLKSKVQEISTTEIAIKRENAVIQQQQDAAKAVEEATTKLTDAEAALEDAEAGTPAHERATEDLEEAKTALIEAEQAVEELQAASEALQEDEALQSAVAEAESQEEITQAGEVLKEAEQERDKLEAGSEEYQAATEKIDALNVAIAGLEAAEAALAATVPGSPENVEAEEALAQVRTTIIEASDAILDAGLAPEIAAEQPEIESEDAEAALDQVAEDVGDGAQEAVGDAADGEAADTDDTAETDGAEDAQEEDAPASPQDEAEAAGEAAEELEGIDETLEEVAEAKADLKNQLVENVAALQAEQTLLIERFNVVLDALEEKGGDITSYRKYIDAVSGIELDIQDTQGLAVRLRAWLQSEEGGIRWGLNLARFVGIVLASVIAAQIISRTVDKLLKKLPGFSDLFRQFLVVFTKRGVIVLGVLGALTSLGVSLGPVLALVGGVSFVLAFALQSNLGNFASGLMLLVNKPFDVGDEVKAGGYWAYVDSISLASTRLRSFGGDIINVPNNTVWGGDIINHTHSDVRQIVIPLRIRFSQDFYTVFEMWKKITLTNPDVLQDPAPSFFPYNSNYEYYIGLSLKAWTKTKGYWAVYIDMLGKVQKQIEIEGIEMSIPGTELVFAESVPKHIADQLPFQENPGAH